MCGRTEEDAKTATTTTAKRHQNQFTVREDTREGETKRTEFTSQGALPAGNKAAEAPFAPPLNFRPGRKRRSPADSPLIDLLTKHRAPK